MTCNSVILLEISKKPANIFPSKGNLDKNNLCALCLFLRECKKPFMFLFVQLCNS